MIELKGISKSFSSGYFSKIAHMAVSDVSLCIKKGETLGLVGESGCGKSTIGRISIRLIEPSAGKILFDGIDLTKLSKAALRQIRPKMQIVFQDPDTVLDPRMTIGESVAEPLWVWKGRDRHEATELVIKMLDTVGLQSDLISRYPYELSGGQKQRAALARALILDPEFIVADEITSALDLSIQAQILTLLKKIQKARNLTILFISHDIQVIRHMTDRVAVMKQGTIVENQRTSELFESPEHHYTKQLINAVYMNEISFRD